MTDIAGNSATSTISDINVDITVPTAPGTPTADVSSPTNQTLITWTWGAATDIASGVKQYLWNLWKNAISILSGTTSSTSQSVDVSPYGDGNYSFDTQAQDNAGNKSGVVASATTTVDTQAPVIASHSGIIAEATGPASGSVTYTSPATSDNVDDPGTATCSPLSGSTFPLGDTTVTCNAADSAGNHATAKTFKVTVQDTTNPTASITSPPAGSYLKGIVTITADASDAVGVTKVEFWHSTLGTKIGEDTSAPYSFDWNTTSVGDGNHDIWAVAYDNAGNQIESSHVNVKIDNTPPVITIVPYNTSWTNSDLTVNATTNEGTLNADSHTFSANGSFDFIATDAAGNVTTETVAIDNIDKTNPTDPGTPTANVSSPTSQTLITWTWSAADATISGLKNYIWNLWKDLVFVISGTTTSTSQEITVSGDGDYKFDVQTEDNAGNKSGIVASTTTTVDITHPTVTVVDSDGKTFKIADIPSKTIKLTFNENITNTPVIDVLSAVGTDTPQTVTNCADADAKTFCFDYTIPTSNEETYTIYIQGAKDAVGNEMILDEIHTFIVDTVAPTITINNPNTSPAQSKTITASTSDGTLEMSNTIGLICNNTLTFVPYTSQTFTSESDNGKKVCHRAIDTATNTSYLMSNTIAGIDTTAPVIASHGDVTVEATGSGSTGAVVTYTSPTTSDNVDDPGTATCLPLSGSTFSLGNTTVTCNATDVAGNHATAKTFKVTVQDTTSPTNPGTPTADVSSPTNQTLITWTWSAATDIASGVKQYLWNLWKNATSILSGTTTTTAHTEDISSYGDGNFKFDTQAQDNAGNVSEVATSSATTFDKTAPDKPTATPAGGDYTSDQTVTLNSSDSVSGLAGIFYTTDGSIPDKTKTAYSDGITVDKDMTIKAVAYDNAGNTSDILSATYGIAPKISLETSSSITSTSTTITWTTDDPSTSRVVYDTVSHSLGTAPNYGYAYSTVEDSAKVVSHSVGLIGLTAETTYYYRTISHGSPEAVSAEHTFATTSTTTTGGGGNGVGGSVAGASAPVCNDTKPGSAPSGLTAIAGLNSVKLTWNKASDPVSYYLITYGTSSGSQTYGNPNIGNSSATSYTVTNLSGGFTYYFKVRAGNGCAPGDYSNEASATPSGGFIAGVAPGFAAGVLSAATSAAELALTPGPSSQPTPTTTVIN
ncbi:HYR domain-containing protein, partial [bacterium]